MFNKVYGFVGLGLMGGSFAKAIRILIKDSPEARILASDSDAASLKEALECGIADETFTPEDAPLMLSACDFVFISLYPADTLRFLEKHGADFREGAIVTDISGVKTAICARLPRILRANFDFIVGHPMAGSEKEGFFNSSPEIFKGRNYILIPHPSNKRENIVFFKKLMYRIGFARITETDFKTHDEKIAFTSQLCHVIAASLVESAPDTEITAFGGGSFEDLTRIAMINSPLWSELFLENKVNLLYHIENFEKSLRKIKADIENGRRAGLIETLDAVRVKRVAMTRKESRLSPP